MGIVPFLKEGNIVSTDYAYNQCRNKADAYEYKGDNQVAYAKVFLSVHLGCIK